MLLKRNIRQISVLHVYHHCSVPVIWWLITYHAPGGEGKIAFAFKPEIFGLTNLSSLQRLTEYGLDTARLSPKMEKFPVNVS